MTQTTLMRICPACFHNLPPGPDTVHLCNFFGVTRVVEMPQIAGRQWQMQCSYRQSKTQFLREHGLNCRCSNGLHVVEYEDA